MLRPIKWTMLPNVLTQCQRCMSHTDLAYAFHSVCAAGASDDCFDFGGDSIRTWPKVNEVFSVVTQASLKYVDRGARNRNTYWQQRFGAIPRAHTRRAFGAALRGGIVRWCIEHHP